MAKEEKKLKCKGLNSKGKPCASPNVDPSTGYCPHHDPALLKLKQERKSKLKRGQNKAIRFLTENKKFSAVLVLVTLLSPFGAIYACQTGATKTNQQELANRIDRYYLTYSYQLNKWFPLGFVLLGIDNEMVVVPPKRQIPNCYIDWEGFELTLNSEVIEFNISVMAGSCLKENGQGVTRYIKATDRFDGAKPEHICLVRGQDRILLLKIIDENWLGKVAAIGISPMPIPDSKEIFCLVGGWTGGIGV